MLKFLAAVDTLSYWVIFTFLVLTRNLMENRLSHILSGCCEMWVGVKCIA